MIRTLALLLWLSAATAGPVDPAQFSSPSKEYYPQTWFHFIDGNVDKSGITKDLEAIAGAGISGVQLFHGGQFGGDWPGIKEHITCLSPNWYDAVEHTSKEAERLGLRFTMQNCPGWAMSGGPWIEPKNAMRHLSVTRTYITGGRKVTVTLPTDVAEKEAQWRDYTDIAVLAFPTPDGETDSPVPSSVNPGAWQQLLTGRVRGGIRLSPSENGNSHIIEINYDAPVTIRSIEFSPVQDFSHDWCYEPGVNVKVDAVSADGTAINVLNADMPMSSWQDDRNITFAMDESTSSKYIVSITNRHDMNIYSIRLIPAARKNSWESEAAWTLRAIPYESEHPRQSASSFVNRDDVMDITEFMDGNGVLNWKAPKGDWTILRIGHVNTGCKNGPAPLEATGWECDKLSTDGADIHFASYIRKLAEGPAKGRLDCMLMDSWECKCQTWTVKMEQEFADYTGYDLRKWLPAVFGYVLDDHETTFRFLADWRGCINYLFSHKFYGRMAENARAVGLDIAYETAAADIFPGDIMEYTKFADVPMCEFWSDNRPDRYVGSINFKPIKVTASAAHIYGKKRVDAESLTSFQLTWDEHLSRLKDIVNQNYMQGVTHSVFHTYTHNPCADTLFPGTSFGSGIGTPFLRGQTWWKHMPAFTTYMARLSYMLETGRPVADVLWYIGDCSMHKPDENAPSFPPQFKYDYCNQDVLLHRLSIKDGKIVTPEGITYSVLWIPDTHHLLPATAARLRELVEAGMILVSDAPQNQGTLVTKPTPRGAHGTAAANYAKDVKALWGETPSTGASFRKVGKGEVISGTGIEDALSRTGVRPDVSIPGSGGDFTDKATHWNHRTDGETDWYFVASPLNGSWSPVTFTVRDTVGAAVIWDPVTGSVSPIGSSIRNGRREITLNLPAAGSCFVVLDHKSAIDSRTETKESRSCGLDEGWTVRFPEGWGAPAEYKPEKLSAWKDMPFTYEGRSFSGTASYSRSLSMDGISSDVRYILDLGSVEEIAVVSVNGQKVSTLWCQPYSTDITEYLHKGENDITIEVTGTWFNRLVYDAGLPESERKTWVISGPEADQPLRPSGLLGPVRLDSVRTVSR